MHSWRKNMPEDDKARSEEIQLRNIQSQQESIRVLQKLIK